MDPVTAIPAVLGAKEPFVSTSHGHSTFPTIHPRDNGNKDLSVGDVTNIVVGIISILIALIGIVQGFIFLRKRRHTTSRSEDIEVLATYPAQYPSIRGSLNTSNDNTVINSIHPYLTYQTAAFAPKVPEQETTIQVLQKMDTVLLSRSTRDEGLTRLSRGSDDVGDISIVRKLT